MLWIAGPDFDLLFNWSFQDLYEHHLALAYNSAAQAAENDKFHSECVNDRKNVLASTIHIKARV